MNCKICGHDSQARSYCSRRCTDMAKKRPCTVCGEPAWVTSGKEATTHKACLPKLHGAAGYQRGCRCDECRKGNRERHRKYREGRDLATGKRCTIEGCDRLHQAKGLCGTHYNQTMPNRYKTVEKQCSWCGETCIKARGQQRYAKTYCGLACRDKGLSGKGETCEIPDDHWARMYGTTCEWTPPKPAPRFVANQCNDCGTKFIELEYGTQSAYCSDACSKRAAKRRRRARERNAPGEFTLHQIMKQYIRQGSVCAYCKQPADGLPDAEHVMPLSRGGRNDMSNLVAACHSCNSQKGDLTLEEWRDHREQRGQTPLDTALTGAAYTHLVSSQPTRPAHRHECAA